MYTFSNAYPFDYTAVAESRKVGSVNRLWWCHTLLANANGRPTHAKLPKTFFRWASVRKVYAAAVRGSREENGTDTYRTSTGDVPDMKRHVTGLTVRETEK